MRARGGERSSRAPLRRARSHAPSPVSAARSYRILSVLLVSPIYATFLVTFGTIAGRCVAIAALASRNARAPSPPPTAAAGWRARRHVFFANMAKKIFGRFLPPPLRGYAACPPARAKNPPTAV